MSYVFVPLFECKKNEFTNCVDYFFMQSFSVMLRWTSFAAVDKYRNRNIHRDVLWLLNCFHLCTPWNREEQSVKIQETKFQDNTKWWSKHMCQRAYVIVIETTPRSLSRHLVVYTAVCMFWLWIWWGAIHATKTSDLAIVSVCKGIHMKGTISSLGTW